MDVLEAEARAGKTVIATTHDLICAAQRFHQAALDQRPAHRDRARPRLVLDQRLLSETYGGHVLVLPGDGGRAHPRRRPPPRPGSRRRAPLPREAPALMTPSPSSSIRWPTASCSAASSRRSCRDRLRGHGHVRRPQGPGLHRRRRQPRRVPGPGHRVHRSASPLYLGGAIAAVGDRARDRAGRRAAAGCASTRRSASCSPGRSPSACCCSARSTATSATCSATCSATSSGSASATSSRSRSSARSSSRSCS